MHVSTLLCLSRRRILPSHSYTSRFLTFCVNSDLSSERRLQWETFTRYVTYFGLCIATCLTFKSSTWIASIIGVAVAAYISVSEYWLNRNPPQAQVPQALEHFFQQQQQHESNLS